MKNRNQDPWQGVDMGRSGFNRETLISEVKALAQDVEELINATADQTGEKIASARTRTAESLRKAKANVAQAGQEVAERTRATVGATDEYVHENPWQVVGIALGVGFVLGYFSSRR